MNKKYLETIKILDGKVYNIEYHQERMNRALNNNCSYSLLEEIKAPQKGLYRCRVVYDSEDFDIAYFPYLKRDIKRLKLIESDTFEYSKKYENREQIEKLFQLKENADDIIIVKNSYITDTTIANIALFDGEKWLTPKTPLLEGTTRARLLKERKIFEKEIHVETLNSYKGIALMNAMIDFDIISKEKVEDIIC